MSAAKIRQPDFREDAMFFRKSFRLAGKLTDDRRKP
jgi:hypothetical protein